MRIAVVIPTLGNRWGFLIESLTSVRASGAAYIVLVCPGNFDRLTELYDLNLIDNHVLDPSGGAACAIDAGLRAIPDSHEFATWLGDDDVLEPGSLTELSTSLEYDSGVSAAFGRCHFIDAHGVVFGNSKWEKFATALLRFGPDFIPQPASLFRLQSYMDIGGLDHSLKYAFDLDLFIRLSSIGRIAFLDFFAARYRWHSGSLSSANKEASRRESRAVRRRYLPKGVKALSFAWEIPMELLARVSNSLDRSLENSKG